MLKPLALGSCTFMGVTLMCLHAAQGREGVGSHRMDCSPDIFVSHCMLPGVSHFTTFPQLSHNFSRVSCIFFDKILPLQGLSHGTTASCFALGAAGHNPDGVGESSHVRQRWWLRDEARSSDR